MTTQTKPIELYYWPTPNGWKITIMLEELGVPYEVKYVNIGKGEQFEPSFLKIAPNNRMPAIIDPEGPDGQPISVFESGAILQYLGRKFAKFYPADERQRRRPLADAEPDPDRRQDGLDEREQPDLARREGARRARHQQAAEAELDAAHGREHQQVLDARLKRQRQRQGHGERNQAGD